jgi:hypothetical protein
MKQWEMVDSEGLFLRVKEVDKGRRPVSWLLAV